MPTLRPLLLLTLLAACGPKNVSNEALSSVPASSVGELADLGNDVDNAQVELRRARERSEAIEKQLASAQDARKEADVSFEKTREAKADAVLSGNAGAAASLDADMAASEDRLEARRQLVSDLESQHEIAEQTVKVRKAEVAWREARLELARAEAAAAGGADVDVEDYRKAAKSHKEDYDKEKAEAEKLAAG